ncbi:DMT family transporter [Massilia sp. DWR3-1-1]|uniref:DMT family transporter n=1 Tax=Massilia sp. DWR3-1-1 TaxID=2804559 RepID=UPI003CE685EF
MTHTLRGILALLLVTLVWGTTFPAMKELTQHFSAQWIIFLRFGIAGVLLAPFLWKAGRDDLVSGGLLGVLLFFCFVFQIEGLALTSSNRNAFICGLSVLMVPLLDLVAGTWPEKRIVAALLLALTGLALLCWDGGPWGRGDSLALACAAGTAVYIKMMAFRTRRASRLMTLTAAQVITVALCAAVWLLARDVPRSTIDAGQDFVNYWQYIEQGLAKYTFNLLFLGVVATAAIISLQSWGQARASANEAAIIYAFEPAAAAFFAYFMLNETMTSRGWLGAALLILGMIVSQWNAATPRPAAALVPE